MYCTTIYYFSSDFNKPDSIYWFTPNFFYLFPSEKLKEIPTFLTIEMLEMWLIIRYLHIRYIILHLTWSIPQVFLIYSSYIFFQIATTYLFHCIVNWISYLNHPSIFAIIYMIYVYTIQYTYMCLCCDVYEEPIKWILSLRKRCSMWFFCSPSKLNVR